MTGTDSAGVPWQGRSFTPSGFDGDDGSPDAALAAAVAVHAAGTGDLADVVAALAAARLLVPVVAALGEGGTSPQTGLPVEKSADMAMVTLRGRDGRVALPVFSGVPALAAWDTAARPVPVDARRAALAAVAEGADVVVLDVAGPVTVVVPRPAVWAVAQGRAWTPSPRDPEVAAAVARAADAVAGVDGVRCEPGERAELRVVLAVRPGLDRVALSTLTAAVSGALAASEVVAERVDSLELSVTPSR
ncbi:MAG: SseB family protein [Actinomycetes bacterium]